jgi:hypothetical protein
MFLTFRPRIRDALIQDGDTDQEQSLASWANAAHFDYEEQSIVR